MRKRSAQLVFKDLFVVSLLTSSSKENIVVAGFLYASQGPILRVNFGLLSMVFVDAWLLYKACTGNTRNVTPNKFFELLACEMISMHVIQNKQEGMKTRKTKSARPTR